MTDKLKKQIKRLNGKLSLACSMILFGAVLALTFRGIGNLNREYQALQHLDLTSDAQGSVGYDDSLFVSIRYGIEIDHRDSEKNARLSDFAADSLHAIDRRIISGIVIYTMIIASAAAYWLYIKSGHDWQKQIRNILCAVLTVFSGMLVLILIIHTALHLPFYFPDAGEIPILAVSLLAVLGGSCFLGWILSLVPFKRIVYMAAVPVVLLLFMQGTVFEAGLYCSPMIPSFDYIAEEIEPRVYDNDFEGDVYYNGEKDLIVLNGVEYPPRLAPNPGYLRCPERLAGLVFELISPFSGNGLFLVHDIENITFGTAVLSLYAAKAAILAAFPLFMKKRKAGL